jgi:DNA modification methylase
MQYIVEMHTDKAQAIFDPFMGSGSTGVACVRTGRNFIGIERDAAHYKTACDRIAHELDGALL